MLAVGAGGLAVNAVKGILGGGGDQGQADNSKSHQQDSKGGDDDISKALASLSKSGENSATCRQGSQSVHAFAMALRLWMLYMLCFTTAQLHWLCMTAVHIQCMMHIHSDVMMTNMSESVTNTACDSVSWKPGC